MDLTVTGLLLLPLGLGLLGFIEPCSIGSTLIFIKYLAAQKPTARIAHVAIFAITRAIFIGLMGVLATALGTAFIGLQKFAWMLLGIFYVLIGFLHLIGKARALMISIGPRLAALSDARYSAYLGLLFGLNIPACAAPLIFGLFGVAAARGASGATLVQGFISLAVFGFALSLPLVAAVLFEAARRSLDWLAGLSDRVPLWTGAIFIALGLWSFWAGLFTRFDSS